MSFIRPPLANLRSVSRGINCIYRRGNYVGNRAMGERTRRGKPSGLGVPKWLVRRLFVTTKIKVIPSPLWVFLPYFFGFSADNRAISPRCRQYLLLNQAFRAHIRMARWCYKVARRGDLQSMEKVIP